MLQRPYKETDDSTSQTGKTEKTCVSKTKPAKYKN